MGGDAPDAPDTRPQAEASMEIAEMNLEFSRESLEWAKTRWAETQETLKPLLEQQQQIAGEQHTFAKEDRKRWDESFKPMEDKFLKYVDEFASPERAELDAGRAMASVNKQLTQQRNNSQQRLNAYGIDPSQTASQAADKAGAVIGALGVAGAGNQSRRQTEQTGVALLSDASNMGRGLPGQAAASYAGAIGAGNSMAGNQNSATGTFNSSLGNAQGWSGQALAGIGQSANIMNSGYQNKLAAHNAGGGVLGGLGQLTGMAAGAYFGSRGAAEGGEIESGVAPVDPPMGINPSDTEMRYLTPGEMVIDVETVKKKGTDHFYKLMGRDPETGARIEKEVGPRAQRGLSEGGEVTGPAYFDATASMQRQEEERQRLEEEMRRREEEQQGGGGGGGISPSQGYQMYQKFAGAEAATPVAGGAGGASVAGIASGTAPVQAGALYGGFGSAPAVVPAAEGLGAAAGASGSGAGGMMAAAGPWAALAAGIIANETYQTKKGRRSSHGKEIARDIVTGKGFDTDAEHYLGTSLGRMASLATPYGAARAGEKAVKNAFTPWKLFS